MKYVTNRLQLKYWREIGTKMLHVLFKENDRLFQELLDQT